MKELWLGIHGHSYIEVDHVGRGGVSQGKISYEWRNARRDEGLKTNMQVLYQYCML